MGKNLARSALAVLISAAALLPVVPRTSVAQAEGPPAPNVVIFLTDDQSHSQLAQMLQTRSLLADQGMEFTESTVVDPLCCPSRVSSLRGQYPHRTGIWAVSGAYGGFRAVRRDGLDRSTLATWLDDIGYRTAMIGKWMNGYESRDAWYIAPGWDYWRSLTKMKSGGGYFNYGVSEDGIERSFGSSPDDYSTDVLTDYALDFITTTPGTEPMFLYLSYRAPHTPTTPHPKYAKDARCLDSTTNGDASFNEEDVSDKPNYIQDLPKLTSTKIKQYGTNKPRKWCRALLSVDDSVATVMETLEVEGRLANTLVIFTSDNGISLGHHRWLGKKVPYEESIRVPLLVRYDPITSGATVRTSDALVQNSDLPATVADLVGFTPPIPQDGESFLELLDGEGVWRDYAFLEAYDTVKQAVPPYCGLRTNRYALLRYDPDVETRSLELYDLEVDPAQLENVAYDPAYASVLGDLLARLQQVCDPGPPGYQW